MSSQIVTLTNNKQNYIPNSYVFKFSNHIVISRDLMARIPGFPRGCSSSSPGMEEMVVINLTFFPKVLWSEIKLGDQKAILPTDAKIYLVVVGFKVRGYVIEHLIC